MVQRSTFWLNPASTASQTPPRAWKAWKHVSRSWRIIQVQVLLRCVTATFRSAASRVLWILLNSDGYGTVLSRLFWNLLRYITLLVLHSCCKVYSRWKALSDCVICNLCCIVWLCVTLLVNMIEIVLLRYNLASLYTVWLVSRSRWIVCCVVFTVWLRLIVLCCTYGVCAAFRRSSYVILQLVSRSNVLRYAVLCYAACCSLCCLICRWWWRISTVVHRGRWYQRRAVYAPKKKVSCSVKCVGKVSVMASF